MQKAFGYIRDSSSHKNKDSYGAKAQKFAIKEYCRENQIELIEVLVDTAVSGSTVDRVALSILLARLDEIDKVLVLNTSRLWTTNIVKVLIEREFSKLGVELVSLEEPIYAMNNKDSNDVEIKSFLELLEQYDKLNLTLKLARGRKTKARGGIKACGEAPLGYRWKHERLNRPIVVVEPEKAELVKLIFAKYLELGSLGKVKEYLDAADYKTNRGKSFCAMGIRHILTNEFYIGELAWGGIVIPGQHEPIINKDTFDEVQAQLNRNRRNCN